MFGDCNCGVLFLSIRRQGGEVVYNFNVFSPYKLFLNLRLIEFWLDYFSELI